jgi:signal peptidase I
MKTDTWYPHRYMKWQEWELAVQTATERVLTWRKRRRIAKKERQKKKNPVLDWLDAILSAVVIVLLINQYLLQAYQIPSESMVPSLLISDRIFVNKLVYGPELVPGMLKMPGFRQPKRADVIIFESPEYLSIGPLKDILQRVVYMVTLSLVDIDRDENGNPKHHFLVKRAIGMPGERIRMNDGNVEILTAGALDFRSEAALKEDLDLVYPNTRSFAADEYPRLRNAGTALALEEANLPVADGLQRDMGRYLSVSRDADGRLKAQAVSLFDDLAFNRSRYRTLWSLEPWNQAVRLEWRRRSEGAYVPDDRLFPMGDNRDNSRDARYFGPVKLEKVLGKGLFRYWPFSRFGGVK